MSDETLDNIDRATGGNSADQAGQPQHEHEYGALFWVGTLVGWAVIAYGAKLLYDDPEASWFNTARLVALGIIAHDIIWLAVSIGLGWLCARIIGRAVPFWVRWAGWTSVIVLAMWLPVWRSYGDRIGNNTILPRDYTMSILVLLPLIWIAAGAYALVQRRRAVDPHVEQATSDL
jgi:hypothetical protein